VNKIVQTLDFTLAEDRTRPNRLNTSSGLVRRYAVRIDKITCSKIGATLSASFAMDVGRSTFLPYATKKFNATHKTFELRIGKV
jgi:hypothetical protein